MTQFNGASKSPCLSLTFSISGNDFDFDEFTRLVGVEPTRRWHIRPEIKMQAPHLDDAAWMYEVRRVECWELDQAINLLLAPFLRSTNAIVRFCEAHGLSTSVTWHVVDKDVFPVCFVGASTVKKLAALNSELNHDPE